jgi:hypothetical protein
MLGEAETISLPAQLHHPRMLVEHVVLPLPSSVDQGTWSSFDTLSTSICDLSSLDVPNRSKPAGNHDPLPAHNDFVEPMIVFAFYQAVLEYHDIGPDGSLTALPGSLWCVRCTSSSLITKVYSRYFFLNRWSILI